MKKQLTVLVALFVAATAGVMAQPKMEIVGGETYDWGKVVVNDNPLKMVSLDGSVTIKNVGNKDLIIDTVKVGCGCTTPTYEAKKPIKPGGTTTLKIGLNVGLQSGELMKNLTIFANDDPNKQGRVMYLKANIFRPITLNPQSLNFAEVKVGEVTTAKTTIKNNDTKPFVISRLFATKGIKIDHKGPVTIKPGDTLQVTATYVGKDRGYFNGNLIVEADNPDFPPFEISAYGNIKGADGTDDPSVIKIDPSKAKDGQLTITPPGSTPAPAAPKKKK